MIIKTTYKQNSICFKSYTTAHCTDVCVYLFESKIMMNIKYCRDNTTIFNTNWTQIWRTKPPCLYSPSRSFCRCMSRAGG